MYLILDKLFYCLCSNENNDMTNGLVVIAVRKNIAVQKNKILDVNTVLIL